MKKSKAFILLMGIGSVSVSAAVPIYVIANRFSDTFKKENTNTIRNSANADPEFDTGLNDSNQGFESIKTLNLEKDLGTVDELSEQKINDLIFKVNGDKLKDKKIYIKGITLKKVKFTVEKFSGTFESEYKITNLDSLIQEKNIGKLKDVRDATIIAKIKEKNPLLGGVSFDDEIQFEIISLSQIKVTWTSSTTREAIEEATDSETIFLEYKCTSVEGLFWNNDLGKISDITETNISNELKKINNHIAFLASDEYKFTFENANDQSPSNVKINLQKNNAVVNFEEVSFLNVTYNVDSIEVIIKEINLGEISDLSQKTILENVAAKNPVFRNYTNFQNTVLKTVALNYASLENESLAGRVTVNFTVKNLSGLLLKNTIPDMTNYSTDAAKRDERILSLVKSENPILEELNDAAIKISNFNIGKFGLADEYITGNSFTLAITGYEGTMNVAFRIKRTSVKSLLKVTDLGSIYWVKPDDVMSLIKSRNGSDFDENDLIFSAPTYTGLSVTAKETSLNYYDSLQITYTTNFKKTTGLTFANQAQGTVSSDQFLAQQRVQTYGTSATASQVEIKYAIPNGYNNLAATNMSKVTFYIVIEPKSIAANSKASTSDLKNRIKDLPIEKNFRELTTTYTSAVKIQDFSFNNISFRTRSGWGTCTGTPKAWNITTTSSYQLAKETTNGIDYFKIKVLLSTTMADYSSCDIFYGDYAVYFYSISVS